MFYHLRIVHRDPQRRSSDTVVLDKDEDWLSANVVIPRQEGRALFVGGQVVEWEDVDEIHITCSTEPSATLLPRVRARRQQQGVLTAISDEWYVARDCDEVTDEFLRGVPGAGVAARSQSSSPQAEDPATVMVVHGQDAQASTALFAWLRSVGLRPREWSQLVASTGSGAPFIGDVLERAFAEAQAIVVLFTPDEHAALREELSGRAVHWRSQARPNVLLEAGMALAFDARRTVLVVLGEQELPSDLSGRHYVSLGQVRGLHALAERLRTAGCPVDTSGEDWLDIDRFPRRSDIAAAPLLSAPTPTADESRTFAYAALLAAHVALSLAYAGSSTTDESVRRARMAFGAAQTEVLVRGSASARRAAEALRAAWEPADGGLFMGPRERWHPAVEGARGGFVAAIAEETS